MNAIEKATARPWRVGCGAHWENEASGITAIYDSRCIYIAHAHGDYEVVTREERKANASLIVKAVNEYGALCAVAEAAKDVDAMIHSYQTIFSTIEKRGEMSQYRKLCDAIDILAALRAKEGK